MPIFEKGGDNINLFQLYATIGLKDDGFSKGISDASGKAEGFASKVGNLVSTVGGIKLVSAALDMVRNSVSGAVERYDTLNRFPNVMDQMGYSAEEAAKSQKKLSDGIQGLPTTLDGIISRTQRLTVVTGDLEKGTNTALAMNNAFLAGGASAEAASRGAEQYTQALSKGKPDMMEWRTLLDTMPYALSKVAESFGYTGKGSINAFGEALRGGQITMTQFNDKIIELNDGVGGFAEMAKTATSGIGTGWTNMQTAVVRGTTGIITSIDQNLTKNSLPNLQGMIEITGKSFEGLLNIGAKLAGGLTSGVAQAAKFTADNMNVLAPAVTGAALAFGALKGIQAWTAATQAATKVIMAHNTAQRAAGLMAKGRTAAEILSAAATSKAATTEALRTAMKQAGITVDQKGILITAAGTVATDAEAAAIIKSTGAMSAKTVIIGLLTKQTEIATAKQWLLNAAQAAAPWTMAIAGVAALAVGMAALDSALSATNKEHQEFKKSATDLASANKELLSSIQESGKAYQDRAGSTVKDAEAAELLAKQVYDLAGAENKSEGEKQKLKAMVDQLNAAMPGLNLEYNIQRDLLNKTATETYNLIAAKKEEAKQIAARERAVELAKEQLVVDERLRETRAKLAKLEGEMGERVNHNTRDGRDQLDLKADLIQTEAELSAQSTALGESLDHLTGTMVENAQAHEEATANLIDYGYAVNKETGELEDLDGAATGVTASIKELTSAEKAAAAVSGSSSRRRQQDQSALLNYYKQVADEQSDIVKRREQEEERLTLKLTAEANARGLTLKEYQDELKAAAELEKEEMQKRQDIYDRFGSVAAGMFSKIAKGSKVSVNQAIKNLQANRKAIEEWKANLDTLKEAGTLDETMLKDIESMGPEKAGAFLAKLTKASPAQIAKLNEEYAALGASAISAFLGVEGETTAGAGLGEQLKPDEATKAEVTDAWKGLVGGSEGGAGIKEAIDEQITASDFPATTTALMESLKPDEAGISDLNSSFAGLISGGAGGGIGIKEAMEERVAASNFATVAGSIIKAMADHILASLALPNAVGINIIAAKTAASTVVGSGEKNIFRPIGVSIIQGLIDGLASKEGDLYKKMEAVANGMKDKLKKAWEIASPSKVAFRLAGFVGQGWVDGMVSMAGKMEAAMDRSFSYAPELQAASVDASATYQPRYMPTMSAGGASSHEGVTIIQNIQSVPQTHAEFESAAQAMLMQARWQLS